MDIRPFTMVGAQPPVKPDTPWYHRLSRPSFVFDHQRRASRRLSGDLDTCVGFS